LTLDLEKKTGAREESAKLKQNRLCKGFTASKDREEEFVLGRI